jgi:hypothetical protein
MEKRGRLISVNTIPIIIGILRYRTILSMEKDDK